jgi:hypothetical protein
MACSEDAWLRGARRRWAMQNHKNPPATKQTPTPIPAPIPAFAPVERPELPAAAKPVSKIPFCPVRTAVPDAAAQ